MLIPIANEPLEALREVAAMDCCCGMFDYDDSNCPSCHARKRVKMIESRWMMGEGFDA